MAERASRPRFQFHFIRKAARNLPRCRGSASTALFPAQHRIPMNSPRTVSRAKPWGRGRAYDSRSVPISFFQIGKGVQQLSRAEDVLSAKGGTATSEDPGKTSIRHQPGLLDLVVEGIANDVAQAPASITVHGIVPELIKLRLLARTRVRIKASIALQKFSQSAIPSEACGMTSK